MVKASTPEEEDHRRLCRERKVLTTERVQHVNRIKGLLFGQGVSGSGIQLETDADYDAWVEQMIRTDPAPAAQFPLEMPVCGLVTSVIRPTLG